MKSFVVLCVVLVAGIQADFAFVTLPTTQNEKANSNAYACIKETGVTSAAIYEARKGNLIDDEGLKKFTRCFFEKADIVTSDGTLNIDVAIAKLPPGVDRDAVRVLLEGCKSKTGKDATDTVYEIFKCYFEGTDVHVFLNFKI